MKIKHLIKRAKKNKNKKTIVFPEAAFSDRTIEAIKYIKRKKIAHPLLIGDESALVIRDKSLIDYDIINPKTFTGFDELVKLLYSKRKEKGITMDEARTLVLDPYYFATLLVAAGYADGMVAGAECSTARSITPALQIIKTKKRGARVSSCFLMLGKNDFLKKKPLVLADCAVNIDPSADELAQIAADTVETANSLGLSEPKVAFLSYSTKGSAKGESAEKMARACELFSKSGLPCDGELQLDSALVKDVASRKCANALKGDANILIFPDLNSGNITYKTMQYVGGLTAVGPILQGLKKPVNDLSRGCTVRDIVAITAITALQCDKEEK